MKLHEITWCSSDATLWRTRVRVFAGHSVSLESSDGVAEGGPPEGPAAYFPQQGWEKLSLASKDTDEPTWRSHLPSTVTVLRLDPAILTLAQHEVLPLLAGESSPIERADALQLVRHEVESNLTEVVGLSCQRPGPADCIVHRPDLISTAFNFESGHFVGLHIDDHQGLSLQERSQADLLLGLNIGLAHRYLLFAPYSVEHMLAMLDDQGLHTAEISNSVSLKDVFLRTFPMVPILRLRVEPGDAYLCYPQNLIHDGATNEVGAADVALLISGGYQ